MNTISGKTTIVVMIPALNEEDTIGRVIRDARDVIGGAGKILVIDDGSTDRTVAISKQAGADLIVSHGTNRGLGIAFQTGIQTALSMQADIIVNIDADCQFDPADIPRLVQPILENQADMVTCSRFLDKSMEPTMPAIKKNGNHFFTRLVSYLTNQRFTDTQCGFRAYSREATLRMTIFGRFTYTQEVFLDLATKGMRIAEVPCVVKGEREGQSRMVKSVISYGTKALLISMRSFRDYNPLKFFGGIGFVLFGSGFIIGAGMVIRYLLTRMVSPFTSLISVALLLMIIGFLLGVLAMIADMFTRQRKMMEEILYYQRAGAVHGHLDSAQQKLSKHPHQDSSAVSSDIQILGYTDFDRAQ